MARTFHLGGEAVAIGAWFAAEGSGEAVEFGDHESARRFVARLLADAHCGDAVRGLAIDALLPARDDDELAHRLAGLLVDGRLRVVRHPYPKLDGLDGETDEPRRGEGRKVKSWIEVVLVDDDGKPVAGVEYAITLPDGTTETGQTDASGRARLSGIDPGMCQLSFTGLDARDWKKL